MKWILIIVCATGLNLISIGLTATADDHLYECTIKHVYRLSANGELEVSSWEKEFKNEQFTVTKNTGKIDGAVLTTAYASKTLVINPGSMKNSYKALAEFQGQYQVIEIQEVREGKVKPFIASSMGGAGIVTGVCR